MEDRGSSGRLPRKDGRPEGSPGAEGDLYVVATVHLDTQWRWTIRRTIREYLPDTFDGNFALFEKYPHYVLSWEGAFRYMLIQEYYPEAWDQLERYVGQGRWAVAGNMLESVDVNLISPESLVRQFLYGSRYFERELDSRATDVFLPDCFGFGFSFPSIAAHCGLTGFSSQKFIKWMKPAETPFEIGVWEGPDGASLLAVLDPEGYGDGIVEDLSRAERWRERVARLGRQTGCFAGYKYFGIGDRGGAPDEASLEWLAKSLEDPGPLRIVHDRSDRFFRDIAEHREKLPRHRGELLLPEHGPGCYTSLASMKRWNRKNEHLADAAERFSAAADWAGALPYPARALEESWVRFLWHQMHDDLTGTSIPQAYRHSWNDEAIATNRFTGALTDAISGLAGLLDTSAEGVPLIVVNPLSIERRDPVEVVVRFEQGAPAAVRVFDSEGSELPSQCSQVGKRALRVEFVASVPPVGCAVVDVRPSAGPCQMDTGLSATARALDSERYRVELDAKGDVARIFDKLLDRELLDAPLGLELLPDWSSKFPAWEMSYEDVHAPPDPVRRLLSCRVVAAGAARVAIEVKRAVSGTTLAQRVSLTAGGERVEIDNRLEWRTWGKILKARFPLAFSPEEATYDAGLGVIGRGVNKPGLYEVPAQQWADQSQNGAGVSILNDCKYGWDRPEDGTMRLTLVRSPWAARGHPHQATQDWGSHRFTYALYGHGGDWRQGTSWQAARLNQPLIAFQAEAREQARPRSFSFARVGSNDLAIRAIKKAEDSNEWIVRLHELSGTAADEVEIELAAPIASAREVNGVEREVGEARVREGKLIVDASGFQPRSFALRLESPTESPPGLRSGPVVLPVDTAVASSDGEAGVDFDGHGNSIPSELLPGRISCGGIDFELSPLDSGRTGCLTCRGQELELPAGEWQRIFLLAAAVGGDTHGSFTINGRSTELRIADYRSLIGEASHRPAIGRVRYGSPRPGFQRSDRIAWVGTHLHDSSGENRPYEFCYLFRYAISEPGPGVLALPNEPRIRLFAASLATALGNNLGPAPEVAGP